MYVTFYGVWKCLLRTERVLKVLQRDVEACRNINKILNVETIKILFKRDQF